MDGLRTGVTIVALAAWAAVGISAQSAGVNVAGDALHVRAPGFSFLKGEPLARLKDGRSVRFDFELGVLARPGASSTAQGRQSFALSYDLWEERFAVSQLTSPSGSPSAAAPARSVSHLSVADAEAWCLDRLAVPVAALGRLGRDQPLWIRLEYRVTDGDRPSAANDDGFTLRGLIDRLSRRGKADELRDAIEAGPFRLP